LCDGGATERRCNLMFRMVTRRIKKLVAWVLALAVVVLLVAGLWAVVTLA